MILSEYIWVGFIWIAKAFRNMAFGGDYFGRVWNSKGYYKGEGDFRPFTKGERFGKINSLKYLAKL